jgi:p21-activated kinase 1
LPLEIQKKVKLAKLEEDKINENFKKFIYIVRYITKQNYLYPELEIPKKNKIPNVDSELQNFAIQNIHVAEREKDLKKTYKIILTNGKGSYGKVVSARVKAYNENGKLHKELVAIKRLPITNEDDLIVNICEVACLLSLKHNNIVQYKQAHRLPAELWIVMEFMEGGSLNHALKVHSFSESHIALILQQILSGLDYVHSQNFAHRDVKSNNIMMSISGNIKLIDFGICANVSKPRQETVGTVFWMAPEMITKQPHNVKCDIWSVGIVALEMYLRSPPFHSSRILSMWKTLCGETLQCLEDSKAKLCHEALSICKNCLSLDPELRPSAHDLKKVPFIANAVIDKSFLTSLKTIFISLTMHRSGF